MFARKVGILRHEQAPNLSASFDRFLAAVFRAVQVVVYIVVHIGVVEYRPWIGLALVLVCTPFGFEHGRLPGYLAGVGLVSGLGTGDGR